MPVIVPANQLNVAALTADDLYISIVNPPGYVAGVPTDVIGVVGTASWGPVNMPVHLGSSQEAMQRFGSISAASLTDPYDLATDLAIAFGQASSQASLEGWGVRVTDGTDTAASGAISGAASSLASVNTISGSVTPADVLTINGTGGVTFSASYTVPASGATLNSLAAGLAAAINATPAVIAALGFALAVGSVVNIYFPVATPTVTYGHTVQGAATESIVQTTGSASTAGCLGTMIYTGVLGNRAQLNVAAGSALNTSTVIINGPSGTGLAEYYPNLPNVGFWGALQRAVNNGLSGVRGPSQVMRITNANNGVGTPTPGLYTFSGGTDGRTGVTSAMLLGIDSNPGTGIYALRQQKPAVGVVWIAGLTDSTVFASCLAFAQTEGASFLAIMAAGTTTAAALAAVSNNGIHDPAFAYVKDWIYFFDPVNGTTRLVSPAAFIGGMTTTLAPQISPSNKPVGLVVGTERFNPWSGILPYTESEVGQLESAGIMFVTNPVPGGSYFGIRHGLTTALQPVTQPFEYWRLTSYLARSFAQTMGQFVGQNQSQQPNDPTRGAVRNQLNGFLQFLKSPATGTGDGLGQIDDYTVICTFNGSPNALQGLGVNTPSSIAQHYLFALCRVRYLSSIRFFVLSLQGGTTVVTVGSTPGQQLVQLAA